MSVFENQNTQHVETPNQYLSSSFAAKFKPISLFNENNISTPKNEWSPNIQFQDTTLLLELIKSKKLCSLDEFDSNKPNAKTRSREIPRLIRRAIELPDVNPFFKSDKKVVRFSQSVEVNVIFSSHSPSKIKKFYLPMKQQNNSDIPKQENTVFSKTRSKLVNSKST